MPIPIIDLFAGPGGLGEGFSSLLDGDARSVFKIKLSIEKDPIAHETLELRAFFRQFGHGEVPDAYYDFLADRISKVALFEMFKEQAWRASNEAWRAELGSKMHPNDVVDAEIRHALGSRVNWVLIGGPPCQAYSLVGRSRMMGDENFANDHRHFLYREYLRIIAEHQPPVFVMENVKGILSATVNGEKIFDRILRDLQNPSEAVFGRQGGTDENYRLLSIVEDRGDLLGALEPADFVVRAENYGIPQARHRIILLGVRSDFLRANKRPPLSLKKKPTISTEQAISDLPRLRSGLSKESDSAEEWLACIREVASASWLKDEKLDKELRQALQTASLSAKADLERGAERVIGQPAPGFAKDWFRDSRLKFFCNHSTRSHIHDDLHRYLFVSVFAKVRGRSPGLEEFPKALLPKHKNVNEALEGTKFNDRFRVQVAGRPSSTITSHISKDGHYFVHYDPTQCRSLTVREAARLQTFPDNYFFEGPRTQQYHQVGNAVPPLLARQIAEIVADLF